MASQTDYAWVAGFIDGDGCISLGIHKVKGTEYAGAAVIITQKTPEPLEHIRKVFGLRHTVQEVTSHHKKYKAQGLRHFRLSITGKTAKDVLMKIMPYLVFKREVAKLALDMYESIEKTKHTGNGVRSLPKEVVEYRRALIDQAKWLNSGRWQRRAAETKSGGQAAMLVSDSPVCKDDKLAELGRNDQAVKALAN